MALTHFTFGAVGQHGKGVDCPAMLASSFASEGIAASGSNQQTTATAPTAGHNITCRVATDTAVYVAFGSNPDATGTGARAYVPANAVDYFSVSPGDKAAVVTA